MINISAVVEDIVLTSEFASEGLSNGCLNLSAYAKQILSLVEEKTKKPVLQGSVVAALSRLAKSQIKNNKPFTPDIEIYNLVTRSGLAEITFTKTPATQKLVSSLYADEKFTNAQFFVVTTGIGEISIITTNALAADMMTVFKPREPTLFLSGLAGLSMQTPEVGITTPNQFYSIIKHLALQRINIVEFVTTFTELTFILSDKDLKQAFNLLHDAFLIH
jgi:hypothetical protein